MCFHMHDGSALVLYKKKVHHITGMQTERKSIPSIHVQSSFILQELRWEVRKFMTATAHFKLSLFNALTLSTVQALRSCFTKYWGDKYFIMKTDIFQEIHKSVNTKVKLYIEQISENVCWAILKTRKSQTHAKR